MWNEILGSDRDLPFTTSKLPADAWEAWNEIVKSYSGRDLTYQTDRLPALSGVASIIYNKTGVRYLAGLWEQTLPANLCWHLESVDILKYAPTQYVAPSWSWASITQAITYRSSLIRQGFNPSVAVVEVHCDVPGLNPLGKVSNGHLVLRGKVIQIQLSCRDPGNSIQYDIGEGLRKNYRSPFTADCVLVERNGKVMRALEGQEESAFSANVLALYLGMVQFQDTPDGRQEHFVLVLGDYEATRQAFCRIGLAIFDGDYLFECSREQTIRIM